MIRLWLLLAFWIVAVPARADSVQNALSMELAAAKARGCANPADGLDRVLCAGAFRVGVRTGYPGFGVLHGETYSGYDIGVALSIARRLGVRMDPVPVTPANRIEMVSNGAIDAAIATMGYSVARQEQIGFVRPAYYASHTAVIGPRKYQLPDEAALAGKTVCVPLASVANAFLAAKGARLMIFDDPGHLLDALKFGRCTLVAHDDSYFAPIMSDFAFAARFEEKLAVAPLPWGIGVARTGSEALERVLSLIVTDMYRTGALADIAHANHVADGFLTEHQAVWRKPDCILPDGYPAPACMLQPVPDIDRPSSIAPYVRAFEAWAEQTLGLGISLPMLTGSHALALFGEGIRNTLILVAGSIGATFGFALLFLRGVRAHSIWLPFATRSLVNLLQSSPVVLLLILAYYLATAVLNFDAAVALSTAIAVLGLSNGANAGSAMADAAETLIQESPGTAPPTIAVLRRSATQVTGFAVNAARGSALASFIGTPELLTALTDIASVSSERKTTYAILLLFYVGIVGVVVWISGALVRRFGTAEAGA